MNIKNFIKSIKKTNSNQSDNLQFLKAKDSSFVKIKGYASVLNIEDKQGDIIKEGAYKVNKNKKIEEIPILWQHDANQPIGYLTKAKEDNIGLYIEGIITNKTQKGQEVINLLEQRIIHKLSIGFELINQEQNQDFKNEITELSLIEISLVTFPANEMTNVEISI